MKLVMQPRLPATGWPIFAVLSLLLSTIVLGGCGDVQQYTAEPPTRPDAAAALRPRIADGSMLTPPPPSTLGPLVAAGLLPPALPAGGTDTTPMPAITPSPCQPEDSAGTPTSTYINSEDGYCLRYPSTMKLVVGEGQAHMATFRGLGRDTDGQEVQVSVLVEVKPAAGETLDQIIAGVLASHAPDVVKGTARQDARVGGQPAVVMEGLPGQLANRQAFVIRNDRLYHVVISPFREPGMPDLQAEAETAWQAITSSLAFLS